MAILSKACKADNFESPNSLKLSFTNILRLLFEFCWLWIFSWIKLSWYSCSVWDKLGWLNWFWQFLYEGLSSQIQKDSVTHMHGLAVYVKTAFCMGLISRKLYGFLLTFSNGLTTLSILLLFPPSITFFVFVHSFWLYFI